MQKMPNPLPVNTEKPTFAFQNYRDSQRQTLCLSDPIQRFLNQQALFHHHQEIIDKLQENDQSKTLTQADQLQIMEKNQNKSSTKKKSIFHNFQKHLITLIKKYIDIPLSGAGSSPQADLTHDMWRAFMKTRSFNKKILHIIFGISSSSKIKEDIEKIGLQFEEFDAILQQRSIEDITCAQGVIREEALRQMSLLSKQFLQAHCHVNKFEQFYEYYASFVNELKSGPMTKRMTKTRKFNVVENLKTKIAQ